MAEKGKILWMELYFDFLVNSLIWKKWTYYFMKMVLNMINGRCFVVFHEARKLNFYQRVFIARNIFHILLIVWWLFVF